MARILIAEDEPDIRQLVSITLTFGGYDVVTTSDGAEAVEQAQQTQPDLILLDVRMPKMTGYEACAALKEDPATADIPVVFLSAKGQEDEVRGGMKVGAVDYILKPFAPDELIRRVGELLVKAAARRPAARDGSPTAPLSNNGQSQAEAAS